MTKIIALFNQAGGVAKTTTTINIGYHLAARKHRVLLVDMDPQASLTDFLGIEPEDLDQTICDLLLEIEGAKIVDILHKDIHSMDLLPSNIMLCKAERELNYAELREFRLKEVLNNLLDNYDYILIDCPPSLGILSSISLVAANYLLVPVQCQYKALKGTDYLLGTIASVRKKLNKTLQIAGFLPTMYQANNSLDKRTLEELKSNLEQIAPVYLPIYRATAIAEAAELGVPLALSNNRHKKSLKMFDQLAIEMENLS